ncbi:MAG: type II toxin-antitoxin system RelE/ParE family toxin [Firmicutes bacterium]|nr:type II toxin-antitoxin system RelE/ParE family toxin [Bacillota bacterium]
MVDELFTLENNPTAGHELKGSMRGARALGFSLPGGEYRAAYVILTEERVCLVFMVGPHEGFYEEAKRRLMKINL